MKKTEGELRQKTSDNSMAYTSGWQNSFVLNKTKKSVTESILAKKEEPKFKLGLPKTYPQRCEGDPFPYEIIPLQEGLTQKDEDKFRSQFDYDFGPKREKTLHDEPFSEDKFCPSSKTKKRNVRQELSNPVSFYKNPLGF